MALECIFENSVTDASYREERPVLGARTWLQEL
jgi:hypothetical protein